MSKVLKIKEDVIHNMEQHYNYLVKTKEQEVCSSIRAECELYNRGFYRALQMIKDNIKDNK